MEAAVPAFRVGLSDTRFPSICTEESIEVGSLIGMTDEPIDFLIHEIDEHFAASVCQYLLYKIEWSACPTERIDKCEGWHQSIIPKKIGISPLECILERDAAVYDYCKIRRQRSLCNLRLQMSCAIFVRIVSVAGLFGSKRSD